MLVGEAETLAALTLAWGDRPRRGARLEVDRRAPRSPCDAPPLEHDTMVAAYLIDPAGRGYPLDELAEREGIGAERSRARDGLAERAVVTRALAERQRERARGGGAHAALPARSSCRWWTCWSTWSAQGVKLDTERLAEISTRRRRSGSRRSSARSTSWPARSSRSARRSSSPRSCSSKLGLSQEAPRQDRLLDRRARAPGDPRRARDHRQDRALARALQAQEHLPRRAARAGRRARAACTRPSTRRRPPPAACRAPTPTSRTSRSAPSSAARSARASWPRRATG